MLVDTAHASASGGEKAGYIGYPSGDQRGGLVLQLKVGLQWRIDLLVYSLGLTTNLKLKLFAVRERIHCWTSTIGIVCDGVPSWRNMRSFVKASLFKKTWSERRAAFRTSGPAPLPIAFSVLKVRRNSVSSSFIVGFDSMGYHDFPC